VRVCVGVRVNVRVWVAVNVLVCVRVGVNVNVFVRVGVLLGVNVGVAVGVIVGVFVCVGVSVGVEVGVGVGVVVGVDVSVGLGVCVGVEVGVAVDESTITAPEIGLHPGTPSLMMQFSRSTSVDPTDSARIAMSTTAPAPPIGPLQANATITLPPPWSTKSTRQALVSAVDATPVTATTSGSKARRTTSASTADPSSMARRSVPLAPTELTNSVEADSDTAAVVPVAALDPATVTRTA
jgi:hypothetical protein